MTQRDLTADEIRQYQQDGVVCLRNAVDPEWVEKLTAFGQYQLDHPGKLCNDGNPGAEKGRMFTDRYLWRSNDLVYQYAKESGCARLAAQAMQSQTARFYFDHLLIKKAETTTPTPWHQDVPYWPFRGKQIASIWLALTPVTVAGSGLEFVRGSHNEDVFYLPEAFGASGEKANAWTGTGEGIPCPDIEAGRENFDIIGFDLQPGDALLFSAWTLHGSPGNQSTTQDRMAFSTRWLGGDAIWDPRPGTDPSVNPQEVRVSPGSHPADNAIFPEFYRA
ncbi:phytanoyl-CoA dioxygenase family protein [Amphritea pacifica]|uniref:phytanoyl-CoA dioxygenase family protein n=1 Tax=Amphritea pacifica TaxID=2811233 RepID=UPI0019648F51|nr:phytanoyl-CoA dioxygenase family protein [Amphritea pacifica]MBN1008226.1 phytanoyl-CoA dioxygenase family protein [Amphritea pacifica]